MQKHIGRGRWLSLAERFWSKVEQFSDPDICWPWTKCVSVDGYGHFKIGKVVRTAQSVALELHTGVRLKGLEAMHFCDNPPCCNPHHLSWGTRVQNQAQKVERGRAHRMVGEEHPMAVLTEDQVREIRRRYIPRHPVHGAAAMARKFGTTVGPIQAVTQGKSWRHVS